VSSERNEEREKSLSQDGSDEPSESSADTSEYEVVKEFKTGGRGNKVQFKKGWRLKVDQSNVSSLQVSSDNLKKKCWVEKSWVSKGHLKKPGAGPSPSPEREETIPPTTPRLNSPEQSTSLEAIIQNAKNEIEQKSSQTETRAKAAKPPKDSFENDVLQVNTHKNTKGHDEDEELFDSFIQIHDKSYLEDMKKYGYTEEQAKILKKQEISKASWERLVSGQHLNDEIARALLKILHAKLESMNQSIAGFKDPKYHGKNLDKRTHTRFRENGSIATANIFNDGGDRYVCAIQQESNQITYCNSRNPGEKPSKYIINQMKAAFDLTEWSGAFKVISHHCQRQDNDKNDSLLWAICNIYIILKGSNIASIKLKEKALRDDFQTMLLNGKWKTLLKKDIPKRRDPEEHVIVVDS